MGEWEKKTKDGGKVIRLVQLGGGILQSRDTTPGE